MDYISVQNYLKENNLDGWLMVDFHGRNNVAIEFLYITGMITRRNRCLRKIDMKSTTCGSVSDCPVISQANILPGGL